MYSEFVESLKRLYKSGKISKEKVKKFYLDKKVTEQELNYILTEVS